MQLTRILRLCSHHYGSTTILLSTRTVASIWQTKPFLSRLPHGRIPDSYRPQLSSQLLYSGRTCFSSSTKQSSSDTQTPSEPPKSSEVSPDPSKAKEDDDEIEDPSKLTLYQRFKNAYKAYGKILVGVHVATSLVWFGSFAYVAHSNLDLAGILESWNFPDKLITPFRVKGVGELAAAYLLYKLATPARYTVTLGGTNLVVKAFRRSGRLPELRDEDRLRNLAREGRTLSKQKMEDLKERSDAFTTSLKDKIK